MKVIEYKVIAQSSLERLIELVNKNIGKGWQPQGGISMTRNLELVDQEGFAQAMVRYEQEPKPIKVEGTHRAEIKTTGRTNLSKRTII